MGCYECAYKIVPNHPIFTVMDKALYNKKTKELIAANKINSEGFIIPEGILSIGDYAFYGNATFDTCISLPSTLERIGDYAFYGVSFSKDSKGFFGDNLISIGDYAFSEELPWRILQMY